MPATPPEQAFYAELIGRLREVRKASGVSQEDLGHKIGVAEALVAKWETGHRMPSSYYLMCWCQALGVRIAVHA